MLFIDNVTQTTAVDHCRLVELNIYYIILFLHYVFFQKISCNCYKVWSGAELILCCYY
jgi:hypothetical protein